MWCGDLLGNDSGDPFLCRRMRRAWYQDGPSWGVAHAFPRSTRCYSMIVPERGRCQFLECRPIWGKLRSTRRPNLAESGSKSAAVGPITVEFDRIRAQAQIRVKLDQHRPTLARIEEIRPIIDKVRLDIDQVDQQSARNRPNPARIRMKPFFPTSAILGPDSTNLAHNSRIRSISA